MQLHPTRPLIGLRSPLTGRRPHVATPAPEPVELLYENEQHGVKVTRGGHLLGAGGLGVELARIESFDAVADPARAREFRRHVALRQARRVSFMAAGVAGWLALVVSSWRMAVAALGLLALAAFLSWAYRRVDLAVERWLSQGWRVMVRTKTAGTFVLTDLCSEQAEAADLVAALCRAKEAWVSRSNG